MKFIKIIMPCLVAYFIFSIPVFAADKKGVADEFANAEYLNKYDRTEVGKRGHYLAHYSCGGQIPHSGFVVEDIEGNDLFVLKNDATQSNSIEILDNENEIYCIKYNTDLNHNFDDYSVFMNGSFKIFGNASNTSGLKPYCIKFNTFCIPAISEGLPGLNGKTIFYSIDGNKIENIEQYLKDRKVKPSDGTYQTELSASEKSAGMSSTRVFGETGADRLKAENAARNVQTTVQMFSPSQIIIFIFGIFLCLILLLRIG
ncbi:MAG: hypothetical protein J6A07_01935, partial [Firmicutes bacterium]|nr:hypothetical protein [Bacillota bacterium]